LAAALLLSACGGGGGYGSVSAGPTATPTAASSGAAVQLGRTAVGTVLVDAGGRTLYAFAADSPGTSRCTGSCLQYWPPASPTAGAARSTGVTAKVAAIRRGDGARQLTVNGWPVYTYAGDSAPGQASGQGLDLSGGRWWVLGSNGTQITSSSGSANSGAY
jgi:predicted lipoprotein with Yx(FWY)xxD motif